MHRSRFNMHNPLRPQLHGATADRRTDTHRRAREYRDQGAGSRDAEADGSITTTAQDTNEVPVRDLYEMDYGIYRPREILHDLRGIYLPRTVINNTKQWGVENAQDHQ